MASEYNHKEIEPKWQNYWSEQGIYRTKDPSPFNLFGIGQRPKYYVLDMFPYPSGQGLHVGHPKGYIASDIISRFHRMRGYNVLHPMGWDAFGLPAENYALKNKVHPRGAVEKNVQRYKEQLNIIGFDYDWTREVKTTDPKYYKWTQWIFVQLFKCGLAYQSNEPINWCPSCKTGLANEDLEDGKCERCGSVVEKKPLRQWVLKIRDYADRLLADLANLDWPESIKESQRNWIGRSEGYEVSFDLKSSTDLNSTNLKNFASIKVFTTRIDTIFGATYIVLAPEHHAVKKLLEKCSNADDINKYIALSSNKSEIERSSEGKEKTGIKLEGLSAINPATDKEIPVFVADYVLVNYGTGAVMAVPAHDLRDHEFAKKFDLPIVKVISDGVAGIDSDGEVCVGRGIMMNSGEFNEMDSEKAKAKIAEKIGANRKINYKLRDWVFSRQRYWGEPIPIIHCEKCGPVAVPEKYLPVTLPDVESYEPTGTGESPLAKIDSWVNTTCPKCGGHGKRETNTMPQWAGSSWYYLRYMDPKNFDCAVSRRKESYWSPVDFYIGGAEHATRHLIYARFWHKFLKDIGVVKNSEPFKKLQHVGLINGEDGRKMSKRFGNVVNPDDIVETYGADTLRVFEMFLGPFDQSASWSTDGIVGPRRFIEKVWRLQKKINTEAVGMTKANAKTNAKTNPEIVGLLHKTIKKVTEDIQSINFNTAISSLMILVNKLDEAKEISQEVFETLLKLLAPFMPHVTEEIWSRLGHNESVHLATWPDYDATLIKDDLVTIGVQVNGKTRGEISISPECSQDDALAESLKNPDIATRIVDAKIKKIIYVPGKIINIVI